jgi:hypothetical protein
MKLLKASSLVLAAAAALLGLASAQTCPTLRVTTKTNRVVRNNKLYTVSIGVKSTGATAANGLEVAVRSCACRFGGTEGLLDSLSVIPPCKSRRRVGSDRSYRF